MIHVEFNDFHTQDGEDYVMVNYTNDFFFLQFAKILSSIVENPYFK